MLRGAALLAAAASSPHVVAHVSHIGAVAQDAKHVAWIDPAERVVLAQPDGTHRRRSSEPAWHFWGELGISGARVVWRSWYASLGEPYGCVSSSDTELRHQSQLDPNEGGCLDELPVDVASGDGDVVYAIRGSVWRATSHGRPYRVAYATGVSHVATAAHRIGVLRLDAIGPPDTDGSDVSPDGTRIAVASTRDAASDSDVFVLRRDGTELAQIKRPGNAGGPRWSPDGTSLAWVEGTDLVVARSDGSDARVFASPHYGIAAVAWSRDGATLAYVDAGGALWTISGGGTAVLVARGYEEPTGLDWAPDDETLYVATAGSIVRGVWAVDRRTGLDRLLSGAAAFGVAASPSDEAVAYGTATGIHVVGVDGLHDRIVTTEPFRDVDEDPAWTPDGSTLVFSRAEYDENEDLIREDLWSAPVQAGTATLLSATPTGRMVRAGELLSAGGRVLALLPIAATGDEIALSAGTAAVRSGSTLTTYALPSGRVIRSLRINGHSISVSGHLVVFTDGAAIEAVDATVGSPRRLALAHADAIGLSIVGNRIAWAENRRHGGVILTLTLR